MPSDPLNTIRIALGVISLFLIIALVYRYLYKPRKYKQNIKHIEQQYGLDNLFKALGRKDLEYPILGVNEQDFKRTQALHGKVSFKNIWASGLLGTGKKRLAQVKPLVVISSLDQYVKDVVNPYSNKNIDVYLGDLSYVIDSKGRRFTLRPSGMEELFGYVTYQPLRGMKFEKLEPTEPISVEELKTICIDGRNPILNFLGSGTVKKVMNEAKSHGELIVHVKEML